MSILELANPYHAYVFGTSFWYFLRGIVRVMDPAAVCGWFRPPVQGLVEANDLELYTARVDAYGLLALSAILLVLADAVPLPKSYTGSALVDRAPADTKKPYARAIIIITMLHHIATGIGSFQHWIKPTHRTAAMDIGVFGNIGLTALGILALRYGVNTRGTAHSRTGKKAL